MQTIEVVCPECGSEIFNIKKATIEIDTIYSQLPLGTVRSFLVVIVCPTCKCRFQVGVKPNIDSYW